MRAFEADLGAEFRPAALLERLGARFHGPAFNALRIEVARGREGIRMIFSGSQPF